MISFYFLANEQREYDSDNRIVSVEYGGAGSRMSTLCSHTGGSGAMFYKYDAKGRVCGWQRSGQYRGLFYSSRDVSRDVG